MGKNSLKIVQKQLSYNQFLKSVCGFSCKLSSPIYMEVFKNVENGIQIEGTL